MCTVWHVDKYKITFKLVINSRRTSRGPVLIDARARYRAAARRVRNSQSVILTSAIFRCVRKIAGKVISFVMSAFPSLRPSVR